MALVGLIHGIDGAGGSYVMIAEATEGRVTFMGGSAEPIVPPVDSHRLSLPVPCKWLPDWQRAVVGLTSFEVRETTWIDERQPR